VWTVAGGLLTHLDQFEIDQLDAALARFAELRPDPLRIPPNAATQAAARWHEAVAAGDWEFVEAFFAPELVFDDRTRRSLLRGDRELLLANDRLLAASSPRSSITVLATAGERLALQHVAMAGTYEGTDFEQDFLQIVEIDDDDRLVAAIAFDPEDRRAASRELLERSARIDGSRAPSLEARCAIFDHDLERVRALLPSGFVYHDHRRIGAGRIEHADDYVAWLAGLFEHSADAIIEPLYVVASEAHGTLSVGHTFGTWSDGGAFESVYCQVVGPLGLELFELEDLELARARFEALRPGPTRIPANAASRASDRIVDACKAGDWDALRALASADFAFEDRGKRALVSGGVETWVENTRFAQSASFEHERLATSGDRIVIERVQVKSAPDGSPVEREGLGLIEVDAGGRIRAVILFDPDDRAAAFSEAHERFVAGEAAAIGGQKPILAFFTAFRRRDWEAMRACLAEGPVLRDRRALGILGTLDRDQWVDSLRAAADLAPDLGGEVVRILAWNHRGRVQLARQSGTRDGGPFENVVANVVRTGGDLILFNEIFDVADTDQALARFAELCADGS
jgi:ketosteroid isomerase-like protein